MDSYKVKFDDNIEGILYMYKENHGIRLSTLKNESSSLSAVECSKVDANLECTVVKTITLESQIKTLLKVKLISTSSNSVFIGYESKSSLVVMTYNDKKGFEKQTVKLEAPLSSKAIDIVSRDEEDCYFTLGLISKNSTEKGEGRVDLYDFKTPSASSLDSKVYSIDYAVTEIPKDNFDPLSLEFTNQGVYILSYAPGEPMHPQVSLVNLKGKSFTLVGSRNLERPKEGSIDMCLLGENMLIKQDKKAYITAFEHPDMKISLRLKDLDAIQVEDIVCTDQKKVVLIESLTTEGRKLVSVIKEGQEENARSRYLTTASIDPSSSSSPSILNLNKLFISTTKDGSQLIEVDIEGPKILVDSSISQSVLALKVSNQRLVVSESTNILLLAPLSPTNVEAKFKNESLPAGKYNLDTQAFISNAVKSASIKTSNPNITLKGRIIKSEK